jgi:mono/diheme cytochrome c family protein
MEDVFPALQANELVLGDPVELIRIIVAGSAGMPAFIYYGYPIAVFWSDEGLTSEEIAKVATFVRTRWGNDAGPVSTDTVREVISTMEAFKSSSK